MRQAVAARKWMAEMMAATLGERPKDDQVRGQSPRPVERDGLVSKLHRSSAYLCRRAALAS